MPKQPELFPSPYHIGHLYNSLSRCIQKTAISRDANERGKHTDRDGIIKKPKLILEEELFFMYCLFLANYRLLKISRNKFPRHVLFGSHTVLGPTLQDVLKLVANIWDITHKNLEF